MGAVEAQSKLNKWANPAMRDVKLVERTLNRDNKLGFSEFRPSEINREPLRREHTGDSEWMEIHVSRLGRFPNADPEFHGNSPDGGFGQHF